jgi:amidase
MARTVKDAAYILHAIAGIDPHDNYTTAIPDALVPDYVEACRHTGLSGSRIGIPRNVMSLHLDNTTWPIVDAFEGALGVLRDAGATLVNTKFTAAAEFWNSTISGLVLGADFVVNLETYLDSLKYNPWNVSSLAALRDFTQASTLEGYPLRDTGVWETDLANWDNTDPRFWLAYQQNLYYGDQGGLLGALDRDNLDAVILPANFASGWAATVGAPIVTVPLGSYPAGTPISRNSWGLVESGPNIPYVNHSSTFD